MFFLGVAFCYFVFLPMVVDFLVGFTLGDLCLFRAFVRLGARVSMLLMATVPPITTLFGLLIMGEVLSAKQLLGMALTVVGVASVVLERRPDVARQREGRPFPRDVRVPLSSRCSSRTASPAITRRYATMSA